MTKSRWRFCGTDRAEYARGYSLTFSEKGSILGSVAQSN
jgi:hypothetical protein